CYAVSRETLRESWEDRVWLGNVLTDSFASSQLIPSEPEIVPGFAARDPRWNRRDHSQSLSLRTIAGQELPNFIDAFSLNGVQQPHAGPSLPGVAAKRIKGTTSEAGQRRSRSVGDYRRTKSSSLFTDHRTGVVYPGLTRRWPSAAPASTYCV